MIFKTGGRRLFGGDGGFDSHSLPPSLSSAGLGNYVSGVRWVCFHVILKVLAGEGTVGTGMTGAKIS